MFEGMRCSEGQRCHEIDICVQCKTVKDLLEDGLQDLQIRCTGAGAPELFELCFTLWCCNAGEESCNQQNSHSGGAQRAWSSCARHAVQWCPQAVHRTGQDGMIDPPWEFSDGLCSTEAHICSGYSPAILSAAVRGQQLAIACTSDVWWSSFNHVDDVPALDSL